jgi:hypothetical protein
MDGQLSTNENLHETVSFKARTMPLPTSPGIEGQFCVHGEGLYG